MKENMNGYQTFAVMAETYEGLYNMLQRLHSDEDVKSIRVENISGGGYRVMYERKYKKPHVTPEILTPDWYQLCSRRTQNETMNQVEKRSHALFGLGSEVGEILSLYQHEYQGKPIEKDSVIDECGDLCWFMCELLDTYNIDFSEVLKYNIAKLQKRYPEGFDAVRSEQRHEKE